ncbi:MAG: hypothetical protein LBI17_03215 [Rickettsiales bacterium]|jgi:hypothetical protein|nr:hypothetical protein [Rickettsiales bacterium]
MGDFWQNGRAREIAVCVAVFALLLALLLPAAMFFRLKSQIAAIKSRQIAETARGIGVIPRIMNASKGYIINSDRTLKDFIRLNILLGQPPSDHARAFENQAAVLSAAGSVLKAARRHRRLMRDPEFIRLNNSFEELNGAFERSRYECLGKSRRLIRLASLPVYGKFLKVGIGDVCTDRVGE